MEPALSIVIVTYNSAAHIESCLAALQRQASATPFETVVVDNASRDGTVARIRALFPTVRVLTEPENSGFAGGVNRGIAQCAGATIALLNPDAIVQPGWVDRIAAWPFDSRTGVIACKVLGLDGRLQSVGSNLDVTRMLPTYRGEGEVDTGQYDLPADVWSAHGAAMAFPRHVWTELAGFDEGYFPAYLEESDFCERVRRAGYRVITAPDAVVEHAESVSTGKYSPEFYFYFLRNRLRYVAKWHDWPELWRDFRPAEHARLRNAPLLDRRVARLVYDAGVPALDMPDSAQRVAILATGQALRVGRLPEDGLDHMAQLLAEAQTNSVHTEVEFRSRLPLVAHLRRTWNNVATRWYVRPNLDQQTRLQSRPRARDPDPDRTNRHPRCHRRARYRAACIPQERRPTICLIQNGHLRCRLVPNFHRSFTGDRRAVHTVVHHKSDIVIAIGN